MFNIEAWLNPANAAAILYAAAFILFAITMVKLSLENKK